jgi:hypothetical protein
MRVSSVYIVIGQTKRVLISKYTDEGRAGFAVCAHSSGRPVQIVRAVLWDSTSLELWPSLYSIVLVSMMTTGCTAWRIFRLTMLFLWALTPCRCQRFRETFIIILVAKRSTKVKKYRLTLSTSEQHNNNNNNKRKYKSWTEKQEKC